MDYYLDCLKALHHLLSNCGESHWKSWIEQDIRDWQEKRSVDHHLSAYGGMGSINDVVLCRRNRHTLRDEQEVWANGLFNNLKSISYNLAGLRGKAPKFKEIHDSELEVNHNLTGWRCVSCGYAEVSPDGLDDFLTRYFIDAKIGEALKNRSLLQFVENVFNLKIENLDSERKRYADCLEKSGIKLRDIKDGGMRPCSICQSKDTAVYRWIFNKSSSLFLPDYNNVGLKVQRNFLKHCPVCGAALHEKESIDKFVFRFQCENLHEWYSDLSRTTYNDSVKILDSSSAAKEPIQILRDWLTKPELRSYLNPETAKILRAIIRKVDKLDFGNQGNGMYGFHYCILCAAQVKPEEPYDWDNPYICSNGHKQATRGGRFYHYVRTESCPVGFLAEICWESSPENGYVLLENLSKPTRGGIIGQTVKPSIYVPKQIIKILPQIKEIASS